jgi:integrase
VLDSGRHTRMMTQGTAEPRRASGERKLMTRSRYQNGSLTLRGRSNKVWVARWREDVLGLDGTVQRVRRSLVLGTLASLPNRRQARVLLDAKLCDLNAGRRQPQSAMPFRNFIEEVWQPAILPTMKFSTQKLYPHLLRRHLLPVFGDQPLCDIRRVDIQRFVTEKMTRQNLSWQTAVHLRNLMSGTLERAVEWGYLEANPGRRIRVPPMQRRRKTVVLTCEQLATLLQSLQEPVRMLAITVAMTGLRIGEVLALRWMNVDFEKSLIRVREAVYEGNLSSPKSKSSVRDIPIGPTLQQALLERRKAAPADAFVFASRTGTPLDSHNLLGRVLKPACKRVGLPLISWHSFRHTHATLLSDLGESLKTAQAQLGHARLSTTAEIYTHAVPASQRAAVEKLERAIWTTKLDPNGPKSVGQQSLGSTLIQ